MSKSAEQQPLLVVGGGIAGITATLEAAEAGHNVVLVEQESSIGGRVPRIYHYFPKLCPPSCGMEINIRRLENNPRIQVLTGTQISKAVFDGKAWTVTLVQTPRYVNNRCTLCGECSKVCPSQVADPFNLGMNKVTAIRRSFPDSWPRYFVLDRNACPNDCRACVDACKFDAIDLDAKEKTQTLIASAIVIATGWKPYPLEKLPELGGGLFADVIANVNMERLASLTGPTNGKILRPSNGMPPKKIAFVQCAGSRDINHLAYCSAVCCLASLKQAIYVTEQLPEAEVTIYYIDRRTPGRNEDMLTKVSAIKGVKFVKGKVGSVKSGSNDDLLLKVEDTETGKLLEASYDLVVLATGMVPNIIDDNSLSNLNKDSDGFGLDNPSAKLFVAGVARRPEDVAASVRDATGAAAKSLMPATLSGRSA